MHRFDQIKATGNNREGTGTKQETKRQKKKEMKRIIHGLHDQWRTGRELIGQKIRLLQFSIAG
jgi:hypothetical protein